MSVPILLGTLSQADERNLIPAPATPRPDLPTANSAH